VQHGAGIWAPSLREHAGTFYIFAPTPDEGIYVLTAPHPRGPWSAPRLLLEGKGLIDPCPLWDDDGQTYLVHAYARSRAGIKDRLQVRPMDPTATRMLGEGQVVYWDAEHQPTLEGPKFHQKDGYYYILAPAGGVERGWQLALRSRNVYGPYEARVILEQGTTPINGPHQGALVDTPQGEWWFVHFQQLGVYGRVVHLNPVVWQDGWPLLGEAGPDGRRQPVSHHAKPAGPARKITTACACTSPSAKAADAASPSARKTAPSAKSSRRSKPPLAAGSAPNWAYFQCVSKRWRRRRTPISTTSGLVRSQRTSHRLRTSRKKTCGDERHSVGQMCRTSVLTPPW
jgi:beta-xylosidase